MTSRIIVVDSDDANVEKIKGLLNGAGYMCVGCHTASDCLERLHNTQFDLIVAELELPDMSGTELCRTIKYTDNTSHIPLVFLTKLDSEVDRVVGLSLGATDYIVKPFSAREFVLRVKAILRRTASKRPKNVMTNGVLRIDLRNHRAWVENTPLYLTKLEFKILAALVNAGGHVLKREQIIETVWGMNPHVLDRTVDAHIRTLRKKMGVAKGELETVQGVGYRICQHRQVLESAENENIGTSGYTTVNDML